MDSLLFKASLHSGLRGDAGVCVRCVHCRRSCLLMFSCDLPLLSTAWPLVNGETFKWPNVPKMQMGGVLGSVSCAGWTSSLRPCARCWCEGLQDTRIRPLFRLSHARPAKGSSLWTCRLCYQSDTHVPRLHACVIGRSFPMTVSPAVALTVAVFSSKAKQDTWHDSCVFSLHDSQCHNCRFKRQLQTVCLVKTIFVCRNSCHLCTFSCTNRFHGLPEKN